MDDVRAAMDAAGSERASLLGISGGRLDGDPLRRHWTIRTGPPLALGAGSGPLDRGSRPTPTRHSAEAFLESGPGCLRCTGARARSFEIAGAEPGERPEARRFWSRGWSGRAWSPGMIQGPSRCSSSIDVRHVVPFRPRAGPRPPPPPRHAGRRQAGARVQRRRRLSYEARRRALSGSAPCRILPMLDSFSLVSLLPGPSHSDARFETPRRLASGARWSAALSRRPPFFARRFARATCRARTPRSLSCTVLLKSPGRFCPRSVWRSSPSG